MKPFRVKRGFHCLLGIVGIIAGYRFVQPGVFSASLVLFSVAYVAWLGRRTAGITVAMIGGICELAFDRHRLGDEKALLLAALWTAAYIAVAFASSAVESATRPE